MSDDSAATERTVIRTPDQRLRVFISSTLQELAPERVAAREAVESLRLAPVMFELGARPHPARDLYRAYLEQSHIFLAIYWERYGWVAPTMDISGLEDEYRLSGNRPKLIYIKSPAPNREPRLKELLDAVRNDDHVSYKSFSTPEELNELIENDLALMLTERFEMTQPQPDAPEEPAAPTRINNLPVPLTPLVGREQELPAVRDLILREDVRLVTLVGPGGTGKSRLAVEVARTLVDQFADGVAFVPLAPLRDPALIPSSIAQPLGVRESSDQPVLESVRTFLRNRCMLLILDNFEHVISAAPLVSDLLGSCTQLTVLATSRSSLDLAWEHEFPVPPLILPNLHNLPAPELLEQYSAVALFVQRARAIQPGFKLTEANAAAVAEICVRLDGLPLAIELAAARVRLFSPQAMLVRLVGSGDGPSSLRLLTSGAKDLPARQQTLRNAIQWSYELLNEGERQLFRRLSVFGGGFTLEAAETIMAEANAALPASNTALDTLDGIAALIDESLLQRAADTQADAEPRYAMLTTIREYALELLAASGEEETLQRRYAAYFLALAETAEKQQDRAHESQLEAEHDNFRTALRWYQKQANVREDGEAGLCLAAALAWFWNRAGYLSEGRTWLETMLRQPESDGTISARAKALHGAGILVWHQGDYATARVYFERSVALRRALPNERDLVDSLNWLGRVMGLQGRHAEAGTIFEESRAISERIGSRWGQAGALHGLGSVALRLGDLDAAKAWYEQSLDLSQTIRDPQMELRTLHRLGDVAAAQNRADDARALYEQALALSEDEETRQDYLQRMHAIGWGAYRAGDTEWASTLFQGSLALARAQGNQQQIAWALNHLADVARCEGDDARAAALYEESLSHFRPINHKQGMAAIQHNLGYLALHRGDVHQAQANFCDSLELFRQVGNQWSIADALAGLGSVAAAEGKWERAVQILGAAAAQHNAIDLSGIARDPANWAEWQRTVAQIKSQLDDEKWTMAWATGYTMTLEQAIAYAIQPTP